MKSNCLKYLYIAHRGIHNNKIIENTIPAFSLAVKNNIPIELDINILKDKKIVVYHDYSLKRLMGLDRELSSYNYDEIKKLTFPNTKIHIPLFSDVLKLVNGRVLLVIEIKNNKIYSYKEYCKKIVSILEDYPYDFIIKSFDIRIVYWFLKNTKYITGLLISSKKRLLYDILIRNKITLLILKPYFISVDYHIASNKLIQDFRKNKPVLVWTIKNRATLNKVKKYGDSFLIDDFSAFKYGGLKK